MRAIFHSRDFEPIRKYNIWNIYGTSYMWHIISCLTYMQTSFKYIYDHICLCLYVSYMSYRICASHININLYVTYKSCLYVTCMTYMTYIMHTNKKCTYKQYQYMAMYGAMYRHICDEYTENIRHIWRTYDHICAAYKNNICHIWLAYDHI